MPTETKRVKKPETAPAAAGESFADVKAALTAELGTPLKERGVLCFPPARDAAHARTLSARVRAAGGHASRGKSNSKDYFFVVEGPASGLMALVTWVSWQSKSSRKALELLDRDAGLQIADMNYTDFVMLLDRVPKKAAEHAKRFAKLYRYMPGGDEKKIEAALKKQRYKTGS